MWSRDDRGGTMPTDLGGRRKSLSAAIAIANGSVEQFGIVVDATFGEVEAGRVW